MKAFFLPVALLLLILLSVEPTAASSLRMKASWYGSGSRTADGSVFNRNDPTIVAHKSLPFGTTLVLVNPANGRRLFAVVKDRGPFVKGVDLDLSYAGARALGFVRKGVTTLRVTILPRR